MLKRFILVSVISALSAIFISNLGDKQAMATDVVLDPYKFLQYDELNVYDYTSDGCDCDCDSLDY